MPRRQEEVVMLGAILAKQEVRKGFDAINRHDLETLLGMFADDGAFEFPSGTVLGGRHEGPAVRAWFERWFERMPKIHFTVNHVLVDNIFAMGPTNVVHAEWDLDETDQEGNTYHLTGVTAFQIEGGKAKLIKDYIFDQEIVSAIWPRKIRSVPG
jgi:ketosteroid isomerase-like protein